MTDERNFEPEPLNVTAATIARSTRKGDLVFLETTEPIGDDEAVGRLIKFCERVTEATGIAVALLPPGVRVALAKPRAPNAFAHGLSLSDADKADIGGAPDGGRKLVEAVTQYQYALERWTKVPNDGTQPGALQDATARLDGAALHVTHALVDWHRANANIEDDPNSAFRWICNTCTTVNAHDNMSCTGCQQPRYPIAAAARVYAKRAELSGEITIAGGPVIDVITEWLVRALVALAKQKLFEANADSERGEGVWPCDMEWHHLMATSQSIFMHRARDAAGIEHGAYLDYIRASALNLDALMKTLETDVFAAAEVLPPVAWMDGEGHVITDDIKKGTHASSVVERFVIPLHAHAQGVTACVYTRVDDDLVLTTCGRELTQLHTEWEFCPSCGDHIERKG